MNRNIGPQFIPFLKGTALKRGAVFGSILLAALVAFEIFNFSTTSFALRDVLGDLTFIGMRWSTVLAIAFCGIDFAGIARMFTPEQGRDEPAEVWYLFGAWLLAASFNAILTWWGVSIAILNHNAMGGALVGQANMTKLVPIFVAVMVWLVRVLIIGTFSIAGERLFTVGDTHPVQRLGTATQKPTAPRPVAAFTRPTARPASPNQRPVNRPEPTYHPVGMSARGSNDNNSSRN